MYSRRDEGPVMNGTEHRKGIGRRWMKRGRDRGTIKRKE